MADIDMIPNSYRALRQLRRTLRLAGIALAAIALLGTVAVGTLRWRSASIGNQAAVLEAATARAEADRAHAAVLQAGYQRRQQDGAALRALRRVGEFDALAHAIESTLTERVWLNTLTLDRDVQALAPKESAADGAAELLTTPGAPSGAQQTWRLASQVELKGQATDYAAITAFLAALGREPGIAGLRLVGSNRNGDGATIDFQATGILVRPKTP